MRERTPAQLAYYNRNRTVPATNQQAETFLWHAIHHIEKTADLRKESTYAIAYDSIRLLIEKIHEIQSDYANKNNS